MTRTDEEVYDIIRSDEFNRAFVYENITEETANFLLQMNASVSRGMPVTLAEAEKLIGLCASLMDDNVVTRKRFLELAMNQMKDHLRRNAETSMGPILNFRTQF